MPPLLFIMIDLLHHSQSSPVILSRQPPLSSSMDCHFLSIVTLLLICHLLPAAGVLHICHCIFVDCCFVVVVLQTVVAPLLLTAVTCPVPHCLRSSTASHQPLLSPASAAILVDCCIPTHLLECCLVLPQLR